MGARNDPKLIRLQMEMKGQGLAIWWCIVEMLWENGGYLPYDPRTIAFTLRWAKPNEVERVLNDFDLFSNDGMQFWSKSALDRLEAYQARSEAARNAGRASGARRRKDGEEQTLNDGSTTVQRPFNNGSTINKINKEIKENISIKEKQQPFNAAAIDTDKLFENFFFRNLPQPAAEVQRFINHYAARGWKLGDGNPVADVMALAENWKPEKPEPRFSAAFLKWYKTLYEQAGRPAEMLTGLVEGDLKGTRAMLRYQSKALAIRMRDQLAPQIQGREIDWKFTNS